MMRRLFQASLTLILLLAVVPLGATPTWHAELDSARAEARESGKLILVDLYADWCGWCKALDKKVFATEKFESFAAEKLVLLKLNAERSDDGRLLQRRAGSATVPTSLVIDADLVEVAKIQGFAPLDLYLSQIEEQIGVHRELIDVFDQHRESGEPQVLETLAKELVQRGDGTRAAQLFERLAGMAATGADQALLRYRQAKALDLAQKPEEASQALAAARSGAAEASDTALVEACDLLALRLAKTLGDCDRTEKAASSFLRDYPQSEHSSEARSALRELEKACA